MIERLMKPMADAIKEKMSKEIEKLEMQVGIAVVVNDIILLLGVYFIVMYSQH